MSIEYLSEIWVVGDEAYATEKRANEAGNLSTWVPRKVIYRDHAWPTVHSPNREAGPVSTPRTEINITLEDIVNQVWEAWEKNNAKRYQRN